MGLQAHVVTGSVGVGDRLQDPVDADPDQVQELTEHHGDLGGIDTVGTEYRTAPALGALIGVHEPFFEHADGHFAAPSHLAENLAGQGKVIAVDGAEQFSPQDRHILRIAGSEEEMALVGAGTAADTAVHENLQGAELVETLLQPLMMISFQFSGSFQSSSSGDHSRALGKYSPFWLLRYSTFLFGRIGIIARLENHRDVHPVPGGNCSCCQGWSLHDAL